ncbi:MAG: N,N-dimethylformamidase beta subunit family domain-containing protein [Gaiellaceae bacterium]
MKLVVLAAAAAVVAAVPGAAAAPKASLQLVGMGPPVVSPNGGGVNDTLHVSVRAPAGAELGLRAFVWGGRLSGWRRVRTGVTVQAAAGGTTTLTWNASTAKGHKLQDGSYLVTVCYHNAGRRLPPLISPAEQRPGRAEASVAQPPWRRSGCLATPKPLRVERLAAYVNSTSSYAPGARVPLVVSADSGHASVELEQDCSGRRFTGATLPRALSSGLYHFVVSDPAGDGFRAPVVVRNSSFPLDRPPPRTALVVWPYLTWRAYNAYDADLNGIPDTWYQYWRQRRVSLIGPLLKNGLEDDYKPVLPFSRWVCSRGRRVESVTDAELGQMSHTTLQRYAAVIFAGHSEYYEPATYDLLKRYRDDGGHLVFLLANPFYRQVRLDRAHNAVVMTDYDARENRSDFALTGVGYDGCCFPRQGAGRYVSPRGADFARVRWLFRGTGIGPGQNFGYAGSESDSVDPELTPRDHVVAGEAIIAGKHGVVKADMVWSRAGRGSVFATGNYDFLRMPRLLTWTLLDNLWRKLVG